MATVLPSTPPPTSPSAIVPNEPPSTSCPPPALRPFNTPKAKSYRFSATDEPIIVLKIAALNAHIAPYGKIAEACAVASQKVNENEAPTVKTSSKSIQVCYKRLQDIFDKKDARERVMWGICGEVTEMDGLLGAMAEAKETIQGDKSAEKEEKRPKEAEKERMGKEIVV